LKKSQAKKAIELKACLPAPHPAHKEGLKLTFKKRVYNTEDCNTLEEKHKISKTLKNFFSKFSP
jgi:hypothetical protein